MSLKKLLTEDSIEANQTLKRSGTLIRFLEDRGYEYKYHAEGTQGYIFEILNENKVIKITYGNFSAKINKRLEGKDFDNVVNIYLVKETMDGGLEQHGEPMVLIVMEMLEDIPQSEENDVRIALNQLSYHAINEKDKLRDGTALQNLKDKNRSKKELKIFKDLTNGFLELDDVGIEYSDFGVANTGYDPKTGNYKLIDVDSSKIL